MEQKQLVKDGAVRCPHCGKLTVELVKTASSSEGISEEYACQNPACGKIFSKRA